MSNFEQINLKNFAISNPAKDFRDKIITLYDEFIITKIKGDMTLYEKDQATRRFLRKVATHSLNSLQENREEFIQKYQEKYQAKLREIQNRSKSNAEVSNRNPVLEVTNVTQANNTNNNPMQIMKDFLKNSTNEIFGSQRASGSKSMAEGAPNFNVAHEMHSLKSPNEIREYGEQKIVPSKFRGEEISLIQPRKSDLTAYDEPEFSVQNYGEDGGKSALVAEELDSPEVDGKKLGLAFSKTEVEEILHEGPLKPNHDGAFEIKKDYMDMSSSEDDETPVK